MIRAARRRAGLSQRALAAAARTSPGTLAAYERGGKVPSVATMSRVVAAAGYDLEWALTPRVDVRERLERRGAQLAQVLDLADHLPARHALHLGYPRFERRRWSSPA